MGKDDRVEENLEQPAIQTPGPCAVWAGTDFLLEAKDLE